MRIKALVLSAIVAGGLLASAAGANNPAAHAAPSAARSAATCPMTVLRSVPLYNHVTIHGYASLIRNLCDGNVFLRVSTDLWGSNVFAALTGPSGRVYNPAASLPFGGYQDTPEIPYTSGAAYIFSGTVYGFWGDHYDGSGSYTAP